MTFCTRCGREVLPSDFFCAKCGFALAGQYPAVAAGVPSFGVGVPSGDGEKVSGLDHLKTSFLLFFIGYALSFVPLVGASGGLVVLIGFVMLVLGWRALGRSSLASAEKYRSTGDWLLYSIVIAIVVAAIGTVVLIAVSLNAIFSTVTPGNPPDFTTLEQGPFFSTFIGEAFGVVAAVEIVVLFVWNMVRISLRRLGTEISQPTLATVGWLFLLGTVMGFVADASIAAALYTGRISYASLGVQMPFGVSVLTLSLIPADVALAVASYLGYKGMSRARDVLRTTRVPG